MSSEEVKQDLVPILNVFGGADGGVAFAKLRHDFLPKIYTKPIKSPTEEAFIVMVKQFSRLCQEMLK